MGVNESVQVNQKNLGFRIYKLNKGGPLEKAGLKMLEDFIIPPEEFYAKGVAFCDWVKEKAGQNLKLKIYSLLKRKNFDVEIKVNPVGSKEGFFGGSVRLENCSTAAKNVLHVIKVKENSFAKTKLGLEENDDYLISMRPELEDIITLNQGKMNPLEFFGQKIQQNLGKDCTFYIYNKKTGGRSVTATIDQNPFFELGCDVAYGKIHEFPYQQETDDEESRKLKEETGETTNI